MRITNNMMVANMMRNLNNNLNRMDKIQNQQGTGKKISKPSDDPVGMAQVLKLSSDIAASEQYKKNVDEALTWLETTEISITQLKDVMQRVRELTVRGSTGSLAVEDKQAIQKEITQLKDQIVTIGNANFAGRYIFGGYNTMELPFRIEDTAVGQKLVYNNKYISAGGMVDPAIADTDFQDFLTNPKSKELTQAQMADTMKIEIGIGNLINVNTNGHELFEKGFGGVFETLTKLEKVLNGEADYKHGFVDMQFETAGIALTDIGLPDGDLDNTLGNKTISITIGKDQFNLSLPKENLTQDSIQQAINNIEHLKKNGVLVEIDSGNIKFSAQEPIKINASLGTVTLTDEAAKQVISPLLIGERLDKTVEASAASNSFTLAVGGTSYTFSLPIDKSYNLNSKAGKRELLDEIKIQLVLAGIDDQVEVSFTEDNRLQFKGSYKDATSAAFDDITIAGDLAGILGFTAGQTSEKAVVKAATIDTDAMLTDIDVNMENILAKLSEIGAKTNRLELDQNRIDDNILNLKGLLSKVQDADMAEVIMNLKMEENVYRASLSVGARIIQPTLIDFIR